MRDPFAKFVHKKITGGSDIYASHWPNWPSERVAIIIHAGSLQDQKGLEGTAHLLEHLFLYEGKWDMESENYDFFQKTGGDIDLETGEFNTEYIFWGPAKVGFVAKALDLTGNLVSIFPINKDIMEKEREIVQREFKKDYPLQYVYNNDIRENKTIFSRTPLERCILSILGSPETIDAITVADLTNFHRQYYLPANISIVAAGGLPVEKFFQLIANSPFSASGGQRVKLLEPLAKLPPLSENRLDFSLGDYVKNSAGINNSRLKIAATLPGTISEQAIIVGHHVINAAIDDEICDKLAWSYHFNWVWDEYENYQALYKIIIDFDDLPPDKLLQTEQAIADVMAKLSEDEYSFKKIKNYLVNRLKIWDHSVESLVGAALEQITSHQRLPTYAELIAARESVTMDDFREMLSHLTPDRLWTLAQEP